MIIYGQSHPFKIIYNDNMMTETIRSVFLISEDMQRYEKISF